MVSSYVKRVGDLTEPVELSASQVYEKYLWRWRSKNGIEDLKKAHECIENMLEALEGGAS